LQVESLRTLLAGGDAAHTPIARALAEANRVGEVHLLDHLVRLGSYSAYQATAHLLLELHARMQRVGMAHAGLFSLPLGQRTLAAALGLSAVHMNRVFKELRADGHIDHAAGWILLRDPQQLGLNVDFTASEAGPSAAC
jgi:CRP-like cAMP-binding protein